MKNTLLAFGVISVLAACAHHDDVRPSSDNQHYVIIKASERGEGIQEALNQATHFCKKDAQSMYVINESVTYQGEQDEQTFLNDKSTAQIISNAGTWLWVLGDGYVDDAGAIASLAGASAEHSLGKPYLINVSFRCST
ncbi:hypothetical protein PCIT_b0099 [Pseudoalteromonas citrea]|uniref:Lipoprotein n=2 Tax=Pseudoalteromonas citrea TaxID=43655 RepID=A0AAD4FPG7_9GAMM|nr:hypothetical protein [Pseudoalteromonas citrea]KAF7764175.1 hypothetical protein PCIT_b0099 [Pseudoalteromonas citrea]